MSNISPLQAPLPDKNAKRRDWGQLIGSSLALSIHAAAERHPAPVLVITPDSLSATRLKYALEFFNSKNSLTILHFPDWEILPYDQFSSHQDIVSERLSCLSQLAHLRRGIIIVSIATLMHRIAPMSYLAGRCFNFQCGTSLDIDTLRQRLQQGGYQAVSQVLAHGEYSVRGSIIDVYPMGSNTPLRLDLLDDELDSIRTFEPDTQRSLDKIDHFELLPAREFPLDTAGINHFRQQWREQFSGNPLDCPIYQDISNGLSPAGIEYYLPLFFNECASLCDYLPANSLLIHTAHTYSAAEKFYRDVELRYEQRCHDRFRPILAPNRILFPIEQLFALFKPLVQVHLHTETIEESAATFNCAALPLPILTVDHKAALPLKALTDFLKNTSTRVLLCAETAGRREALLELLAQAALKPQLIHQWDEFLNSTHAFAITVSNLEEGMLLQTPAISIITETQLLGEQVMQRRQRKHRTPDSDAVVRNLAELQVGSPVVHIEHGVGRYGGLQTLNIHGTDTEFLMLTYQDDTKLYVPIASLHLISRYTGADPEHAPLHRLGSDQWTKLKRKATEKARDVAAELLDVYARRAARQGFQFKTPDEHYQNFVSSFPFEETPDQQQAIADTLRDMTSPRPMDRLICGDVGFGKTEVAMRAVFLAIQGGKQVAVLVPTTLLAQQHYENFRDRFADWPIHVEVMSRFRSKKELDATLKNLENGTADVVIGTHKLIQDNIRFANLGLLVIDEEHRFGVQQKERLKALRAEVDILNLTATPIPRTLNMALSGTRDLSIIATPPARRLSIKTFVREYDTALIQEAVNRELARGGQVYFLHNAVESIERVAEELTQLLPEARIAVAHGQLRERDLERIMSDFYHHRFNLLICSTIIETGIDIPTANTIIINRADRFGLAQLHQLRGRVGRSHHQAYAYLLTPDKKNLTAEAAKRLEAIAALEDLGVGFTLATHDLEIRGAGELLGDEQSGHMQAIGYSLYMEILERAVQALKSGKQPDLDKPFTMHTEIDLQLAALIPESYLADVHMRLVLYKRIASAKTTDDLHQLQVEMVDRFGLLPDPCKQLFQVTALKLQAEALGIQKIEANAKSGRVYFNDTPNIDPVTLIKLIQVHAKRYRLEGPTKLKFTIDDEQPVTRLNAVKTLLTQLEQRN